MKYTYTVNNPFRAVVQTTEAPLYSTATAAVDDKIKAKVHLAYNGNDGSRFNIDNTIRTHFIDNLYMVFKHKNII